MVQLAVRNIIGILPITHTTTRHAVPKKRNLFPEQELGTPSPKQETSKKLRMLPYQETL